MPRGQSVKRFEWSNGLDTCSFSCFPCVGVRLVYWSLQCTSIFVIRFHWSLLLAFSLHFSSFSAFLRSLFTKSSHLSWELPRFLQPSCYIKSYVSLQAARDGLLDIVLAHLRLGVSHLYDVDEDGYTALHHATRYNRVNVLEVLIDAGAGE